MRRFKHLKGQWGPSQRPSLHPRPREARWMDAEYRDRIVPDSKPGDDLQNAVQDALRQDTNLRSYGLEGTVIEGTARVQGVVDTLAEKLYIKELITAIPGIEAYQDGVSVSTDGAITDNDVEMEISEELSADPMVGDRVGVQVREGIAYLLGQVASREMESQALQLASRARGVVSVISQLAIEPSLQKSP